MNMRKEEYYRCPDYVYKEQLERQIRRVKEEEKRTDELLTLGLIRKMLGREKNPECHRCPIISTPDYVYDYVYKEQLERQIRRVKEEEKRTDELLTLGLIRKMLERERNIRK